MPAHVQTLTLADAKRIIAAGEAAAEKIARPIRLMAICSPNSEQGTNEDL